jgi:hypothetical protein
MANKVANLALAEIARIGLHVRRFQEPTGYDQKGGKWLSSGYFAQAVTLSFESQYVKESSGGEIQLDADTENILAGLASLDPERNNEALLSKIYSDVVDLNMPNLSGYQKRGITNVMSDPDKIHKFYPKNNRLLRPYAKTAADLATSQYSFLLK